jgi:hypothetical protein
MTTKLPDAPQRRSSGSPGELPPDPMIVGMKTIAGNYQARVNEAGTTGFISTTWDPHHLARAALAFESEMVMLSRGHDIDHHGGERYTGTTVTLDQDADVQSVTDALLGQAGYILGLADEAEGADGVRRYLAARAAVTGIVQGLIPSGPARNA